jgi:hypothetical protein
VPTIVGEKGSFADVGVDTIVKVGDRADMGEKHRAVDVERDATKEGDSTIVPGICN